MSHGRPALARGLRLGTLDLAEGVFTSVGGRPRQQIFMLNLATNPASLTAWTSPEFSEPCSPNESFYVRAASWSR